MTSPNPKAGGVGSGNEIGYGSNEAFQGNLVEDGFSVDFLISVVNDATVSAKRKLETLKARRSSISIADMFDMQMLMNHLSQLSEMSTNVVGASNNAIMSMARNVKA
jgi:hypothetical protein